MTTSQREVSASDRVEGDSANDQAIRPQLDHLRTAVETAAALLPISGPITAFAFLNTLMALEDLPFDEGMALGAKIYGCQPWLSEERYREKMARGRIRIEDLGDCLREDLKESGDIPVAPFCNRYDLRLAMMTHPLHHGPVEDLRWYIAEMGGVAWFQDESSPGTRANQLDQTRRWIMSDLRGRSGDGPESPELVKEILDDVVSRFGAEGLEFGNKTSEEWDAFCVRVLWRICYRGVRGVDPVKVPSERPLRLRDLLLEAMGQDSDLLVHEMLIRFCAAFTDQGFASWALPFRKQGFYKSFLRLYQRGGGPPHYWTAGLAAELTRLTKWRIEPLESIRESLAMLGYAEDEWNELIQATLMALRGWAGMLWQMEVRPDRVPTPVPPGTLIEFVAVRLVLERIAIEHLARKMPQYDGKLNHLRTALLAKIDAPSPANAEQRAFAVFQLAQALAWSPPRLARLSAAEWNTLVSEIESFSELDRRRIMHRAFERRFQVRALDAMVEFGQRKTAKLEKPSFQAVFCIDAREESFRRHIEEVSPRVETFGAAGFFGVPMYYRGVSDANFAALCPIVMKPSHWVIEDVVYTLDEENRRRKKARWALGTAWHQLHLRSRSIAGGAVLTATLGVLASIPLVARVLFPGHTARFRRLATRILAAPSMTRLRLRRSGPKPGPENGNIGFTIEEMANLSERTLRDIGLTSDFARLVLILGHGSTSLNNPHKSVYDCGACTGSPGGPNARALASMLNDPQVRTILAGHGVQIPNDTLFIGGLHNTSEDTVTFYDLEMLLDSHISDFEEARRVLHEACDRNSHERCRRFDSASLDLSFAAAHQHAEQRTQDLAQARPEFGNASNAMCVVGRRQRTRGLYLDRRSFLMSYDSTQDDATHSTLERILSAVVPVCEGINMQYLLSYMDSTGWGCGTKLPHNVTSLLGIMDGALSDLRPGLPWQGVEIHEPIRLLFVIESTPDAMLQIMARNKVIGRILLNGWAHLAVFSPTSGDVLVFRDGKFQPYTPSDAKLAHAATSTHWYRGWRDHLDFAVIEGGCAIAAEPEAKAEHV